MAEERGPAALYTPAGIDIMQWWPTATAVADASDLEVVTFAPDWPGLMHLIWCSHEVDVGIIIAREHIPRQPLIVIEEHQQPKLSLPGQRRPQIRYPQ